MYQERHASISYKMCVRTVPTTTLSILPTYPGISAPKATPLPLNAAPPTYIVRQEQRPPSPWVPATSPRRWPSTRPSATISCRVRMATVVPGGCSRSAMPAHSARGGWSSRAPTSPRIASQDPPSQRPYLKGMGKGSTRPLKEMSCQASRSRAWNKRLALPGTPAKAACGSRAGARTSSLQGGSRAACG